MPQKDHKLAAIVFTDIVGYTRQMEEDEQRTMQLLQTQRDIIFPLIEEYGGELIKEIGDGLLMMFSSSVEAVRFAIKVQQRLKDEELTIRAGIHMGDVIFKDSDVFGSAVNTAARIEPLAEPNGICISEDVKQQLGNKNIRMISCGRKELKGVNRPIEIFEVFIEGVSQERKRTASSFIKDIWNRYVVQIAMAYLVAAWVIKLAVSSIVARNFLSPHIVELTWIILISLLPTVMIISYFHSNKGRNKWHKAELIGLPANILLSIMLLVIMFDGKDLGAATEAVIIQNEDGESVERYVVKSEFRKKICLYNIENISGDTSLNWLQYMFPTMVEYDLAQDEFISPMSANKFFEKLKGAGFEDGIGLPVMLMKKFAANYHLNYFSSGTFDIVDGKYIVTIKLYGTKTGKLLKESVFEGKDIFIVADEISVKTKEDMGIPIAHIEEADDLLISEIFTNSPLALEYYAMANKEKRYANWDKAVEYFEAAIKEDPGFAIIYVELGSIYFNTNKMDNAEKALQMSMDNIDKIPERMQFVVKYLYYLINLEPEKAQAVIKMWTELYPEDVNAHTMLAQLYMMSNNKAGAISEYMVILQLDPEQYSYLPAIGRLYEQLGKSDSAIYYFHQYAEKFPKDYKSYLNIGDHYNKVADFENAKKYLDKAYLLEPSNISISIKISTNELDAGNFEEALDGFNKALGRSKTAKDSIEVISALSSFYQLKGQILKSLEFYEDVYVIKQKVALPLQLIAQKCFFTANYVAAGKQKEIFNYLDKAKAELDPPLDKITAFGYMLAYLELDDADNAEKQIPDAEELAKGFGEEVLLANIYYAWGRIYEIRGEYEKALESYDEYFENQPSSYQMNKNVSRVYRKMKQFDKSEKHILIALKHDPYSAWINYEAALLYYDMGEEEKARMHLELANEIWKDADTIYEPAREAREKLMEMGS